MLLSVMGKGESQSREKSPSPCPLPASDKNLRGAARGEGETKNPSPTGGARPLALRAVGGGRDEGEVGLASLLSNFANHRNNGLRKRGFYGLGDP